MIFVRVFLLIFCLVFESHCSLPGLSALDTIRMPNPWPYLASTVDWLRGIKKEEPPLGVETLQYVYLVTRHGSRSPVATYPTDPYPYYDLKYWPDGAGQLTRVGKQQMYAAGQNYRLRYNGFLSEYYNVNDTLVRSNIFDRDYMSASCLLAGLYPPVGYQQWNPYILWQPISIWEEPFDIAETLRHCPKHTVEFMKVLKSLSQEHAGSNQELMNYLSEHMGTNSTSLVQVFTLWDCLTMQTENGYKIPSWTKKVYPEKLAPIYSELFYAYLAGTPEMIRLTGGPLLQNVSVQLSAKAEGRMNPSQRKFYVEAAHDITLQALLAGLGIEKKLIIDTSASMSFELHDVEPAGHVVQVLYFNNSATPIPRLVRVPSCGEQGLCTLAQFNQIVSQVAPDDWKQECQL